MLLLFWSLYFAAVGLTNLLDLLRALGLLPDGWRYLAGNLPLIGQAVGSIGLPPGMAGVLLVGVILWEGLAAWRFWQAIGREEMVGPAFVASIGLWALFMLADEILLTYALEAVHLRLFIAQLLSLLVLLRLSPTER